MGMRFLSIFRYLIKIVSLYCNTNFHFTCWTSFFFFCLFHEDFEPDTLEQLIAFSYTGSVRITAANVQSMMHAANFLQLNGIVDECSKFLKCRLHAQNVLGIRSFAMALGCVSLVLSAGS